MKRRLKIREARRLALEYAIDTLVGGDFDQIWGDDIANEAWNSTAYSKRLDDARKYAADRIRSLIAKQVPTTGVTGATPAG